MMHAFAGVLMLAGAWPSAAQQADQKVSDLDVLYIQRAPKFPGYLPRYDLPGRDGQPLLTRRGANGETVALAPEEDDVQQRWPTIGQEVTYCATVENKGAIDAPPFGYAWYVDGQEVAAAVSDRPLQPGQRRELTFSRPWDQERHEIACWVDPMRRVRQVSYANDRRSVWTHAKLLICYADAVTYASFAKSRNFLGTCSFEDWCQAHADWMNELFARSKYAETAPEGIVDRVAVDFIGVLEDEAARDERWRDSSPLNEGWDGGWWFGRNADCTQWAAGMDWGLIHEWGHQLGLTDLYALDVAPENNLVLDAGGSPLLIGRLSVFRGTMMHGHGPVVFSEDQAIALNHQLWRRRGYYGDYYFNLADQNDVIVRDAAGESVPRAKLRFWQRDADGVFEGVPTFVGQTAADGRFQLPNRAAPDVATYGTGQSGYRLRPNPFGQINVVGVNDVFLVEIEARGQTEYTFLEITQFNVARARQGARRATVALDTQLPLEGAPQPPAPPDIAVSGDTVRLSLPGRDRWVVLRADPTEYGWRRIGDATDGSFVDTLPRSGLFRYAAAFELTGKLSARSAPRGVAAMADPWGLALAPDGTAYVRDRANGQTLVIRRDGSAVGYVGSVHWHLEGSYDHATDAHGLLYVAKWADGYDPKRSWIRRIDPRGKGREHDRRDLAGGEIESDAPGRFRQPMGIWVAPDNGTIVVADTGNNRVQLLKADGGADRTNVVSGLNQPHKALLSRGRLVVCDTGSRCVRIFESADGNWVQAAVLDGFERPTYGCIGPADELWIADGGAGRIFAINAQSARRLDWQFPGAEQPPLVQLRGIAFDASQGDLLYLDGLSKRLVRTHVRD